MRAGFLARRERTLDAEDRSGTVRTGRNGLRSGPIHPLQTLNSPKMRISSIARAGINR